MRLGQSQNQKLFLISYRSVMATRGGGQGASKPAALRPERSAGKSGDTEKKHLQIEGNLAYQDCPGSSG